MRSFFLALFVAVCGLCAAIPASAQNTEPPENHGSLSSATKPKAKKVWTDEDLPSAGGATFTGSYSGSHRPPGSVSHGATITSPPNGQIVHPGDTIHVDVLLDSGSTPVKGAIVSPLGNSREIREGPPYSFTFAIPDDASGDRLIGFQQLSFLGKAGKGKDMATASIALDVEEAELPLSISASVGDHFSFSKTGEDKKIEIYAKFPDGRAFDVSGSAYLSFSSENSAVAVVRGDGNVSSAGAGLTRIIAAYTLGSFRQILYIPVRVQDRAFARVGKPTTFIAGAPAYGLNAFPPTFDFGDIAIGTTGWQIHIVITNQSREDIHIFVLEARGFWPRSENCSNTTLAPGGWCTITVAFAPVSRGVFHGSILVPNDQSGSFSVPLMGRGI
jgi:hypothetical protein